MVAHPGEPESMLDDRVLGAIAVTRGMLSKIIPNFCL